jgi:hypothetical protein
MNSALERKEIIGWCDIQRMALPTLSVFWLMAVPTWPAQTSRLVVTEQEDSDIRSRPFGVRPSYDDELGAVEAFDLDPGTAWRRTGLSAIRPGLFPCMRRAPHWKRR